MISLIHLICQRKREKRSNTFAIGGSLTLNLVRPSLWVMLRIASFPNRDDDQCHGSFRKRSFFYSLSFFFFPITCKLSSESFSSPCAWKLSCKFYVVRGINGASLTIERRPLSRLRFLFKQACTNISVWLLFTCLFVPCSLIRLPKYVFVEIKIYVFCSKLHKWINFYKSRLVSGISKRIKWLLIRVTSI